MGKQQKTWRDDYRPIIQQGLIEGLSPEQIRKDHYPAAQRRGFAYQVWLNEIKRAEQFLLTGLPVAAYSNWSFRQLSVRQSIEVEGQLSLFSKEPAAR